MAGNIKVRRLAIGALLVAVWRLFSWWSWQGDLDISKASAVQIQQVNGQTLVELAAIVVVYLLMRDVFQNPAPED